MNKDFNLFIKLGQYNQNKKCNIIKMKDQLNICFFDKHSKHFSVDKAMDMVSAYIFTFGSISYIEEFMSDCINKFNINQKNYENIILILEDIFFKVNLKLPDTDVYSENYYKSYCKFINEYKNIEKFKNIIIMKDILI